MSRKMDGAFAAAIFPIERGLDLRNGDSKGITKLLFCRYPDAVFVYFKRRGDGDFIYSKLVYPTFILACDV